MLEALFNSYYTSSQLAENKTWFQNNAGGSKKHLYEGASQAVSLETLMRT